MKRCGVFIVLFLTGCGKEIIREELEGKWVATGGYQNGTSTCVIIETLQFVEVSTVLVNEQNESYKYTFDEFNDKTDIVIEKRGI